MIQNYMAEGFNKVFRMHNCDPEFAEILSQKTKAFSKTGTNLFGTGQYLDTKYIANVLAGNEKMPRFTTKKFASDPLK